MTTTYTHITLLDVDQAEAAEWLAENDTTAAVSPTVNDTTLVFDNVLAEHADDDEPLDALLLLASEMSYELGCPAWLMIVNEDDALIYSLYRDGDLIDTYGVNSQSAPDGGDPELLAALFDRPKKDIKNIRAILKRPLKREHESASQRLRSLLDVLGVPPLGVNVSYASLKADVAPPAFSLEDVVFVEPDEDENATDTD